MAAQALTNNQKLGYAYAAAYGAVGLLGFTVTGGYDFGGAEGGKLLGIFQLNGFHNGIHLILSLVFLIGAASGYVGARGTNLILGALLVGVGFYGFLVGNGAANFIAANPVDNLLHLATGGLALAVGYNKDFPAPQSKAT